MKESPVIKSQYSQLTMYTCTENVTGYFNPLSTPHVHLFTRHLNPFSAAIYTGGLTWLIESPNSLPVLVSAFPLGSTMPETTMNCTDWWLSIIIRWVCGGLMMGGSPTSVVCLSLWWREERETKNHINNATLVMYTHPRYTHIITPSLYLNAELWSSKFVLNP